MKVSWLNFAFEEMRFIRTFSDLNRFCQKFPFMAPRLLGWGHRHTRVPLSLQIEPTNHCNVDCICCSRSRMKREKGFMDVNLFKRIIDDAFKQKIRRVFLYLHGEPFLHPDIYEMIQYVKSKQIGVTLATNGMKLYETNIKSLLKAGLDNADHIIFSILGYSKEVHEQIMNGVNHDEVLNNIMSLLKMRKESNLNGPVVETIIYAMPENRHEIAKFVYYWRDIVDHVRQVADISEQFSNKNQYNNNNIFRSDSCNNLWERMTILWNGDVTVCIADIHGNHVIENIAKYSIEELWNSPKLLTIKKIHKAKQFDKFDLCANCDW